MAKMLETGLKVDGEFFPAGTLMSKLSKVAKEAAKKADILINQPLAPREDEPEEETTEEE